MDKSTSRIVSKAGFFVIIIGFLMSIIYNQNGFQTVKYLSNHFRENTEYLSELLDQIVEPFQELHAKKVGQLSELHGNNTDELKKTIEREIENLEKSISQEKEKFSIFKTGKNVANISLYGIFIISCIGVLLFVLLLLKKWKFGIIFDWTLIILSIISILALFSGITNVLRYTPNEFSVFDISGIGKRVGSIGDVFFPLINCGSYFTITGLIISIIFNLFASFTCEKNGKIKYDITMILIFSFVIFSIIIGCSLAIITG